jgi:uncharacterized RDD family membrane protein YckC
MDTRPPGDELDPQAAPRQDAPAPPYALPPPEPEEWQVQPQAQPAAALLVPIPGAVAYEGALLVPAGFAPRFLAFLIDIVVLGILAKIFILLIGYHEPDPEKLLGAFRAMLRSGGSGGGGLDQYMPPSWLTFMQYCIYAAYYTLFHSFNGATVGKMALGLQVRHRDGRPLTLGLAFARWVGYWFTGWLAYTSWLIPFESEKRTAYDWVLKLNVFKVVQRPH